MYECTDTTTEFLKQFASTNVQVAELCCDDPTRLYYVTLRISPDKGLAKIADGAVMNGLKEGKSPGEMAEIWENAKGKDYIANTYRPIPIDSVINPAFVARFDVFAALATEWLSSDFQHTPLIRHHSKYRADELLDKVRQHWNPPPSGLFSLELSALSRKWQDSNVNTERCAQELAVCVRRARASYARTIIENQLKEQGISGKVIIGTREFLLMNSFDISPEDFMDPEKLIEPSLWASE